MRRHQAGPDVQVGAVRPEHHSNRRIELAQLQLCRLLDRHPASRMVFGHLASLERSLRRAGPDALRRLSVLSLRRAWDQLHEVGGEADAPGLAALLEEALAGRAPPVRRTPVEPTVPHPQDFSLSQADKFDLTEVDAATYFEVMRAWQDTLVNEEQGPAAAVPQEPTKRSASLPMVA